MFDSVFQNPVAYSDPWTLSFEKRQAALVARPKRIAYYYEKPDATTFRYRVFNMIQALEADPDEEISASWFCSDDLPHMLRIVDQLDAIVFCRTRFTPQIGELVTRAKRRGVTVLYDIDDLVFDTDHIQLILTSLGQDVNNTASLDGWFAAVSRQGTLLRMCDRVIATNHFLARRLGSFAPQIATVVVPNFLNREQQAFSDQMFAQKLERQFESSAPFHIGYFSGTLTHRRDFDIVTPTLVRLLAGDSRLRLLIVGLLEPDVNLMKYRHRIDRFPLQDYMNLQRLIARTEINIAPVLDNVFTNCKSELKYFEAAIVGTITIASPTFTFRHAIEEGRTGFLAGSHQWDDKLGGAITMLDDRQRYADMAIAGHTMAKKRFGWNEHVQTIKEGIFDRNLDSSNSVSHTAPRYAPSIEM